MIIPSSVHATARAPPEFRSQLGITRGAVLRQIRTRMIWRKFAGATSGAPVRSCAFMRGAFALLVMPSAAPEEKARTRRILSYTTPGSRQTRFKSSSVPRASLLGTRLTPPPPILFEFRSEPERGGTVAASLRESAAARRRNSLPTDESCGRGGELESTNTKPHLRLETRGGHCSCLPLDTLSTEGVRDFAPGRSNALGRVRSAGDLRGVTGRAVRRLISGPVAAVFGDEPRGKAVQAVERADCGSGRGLLGGSPRDGYSRT